MKNKIALIGLALAALPVNVDRALKSRRSVRTLKTPIQTQGPRKKKDWQR